jgi:hypothetical protein
MDIEAFLKCYTAFADEKSQSQQAEEAPAEKSQPKLSVAALFTALRNMKIGQAAKARPR